MEARELPVPPTEGATHRLNEKPQSASRPAPHQRSYTEHGTYLPLGSPFTIHGIVDELDPILESAICIGQTPRGPLSSSWPTGLPLSVKRTNRQFLAKRIGVGRCGAGWTRSDAAWYRARRYGAWRSLVSAPVWGTGGPEFESRRPDQTKALHVRGFRASEGLNLPTRGVPVPVPKPSARAGTNESSAPVSGRADRGAGARRAATRAPRACVSSGAL
jgi:hypothetical protein